MALPGVHLSKKRRRKLRGEKYRPLASNYKNKAEVAAAARRKAAGEVKPEVSSLTQEGKEARRTHGGRNRAINQQYEAAEQSIREARDRVQQAYDQYVATNTGAAQNNIDSLAAALANTRSINQDAAAISGGVLPEGNDEPTLTAATAGATSNAGLSNVFGLSNLGVAEAAPVGFAIGKVRALEKEQSHFQDLLDAIHEKRTAAKAKIGPAITKAEQEINQEELAKVSERERENIAEGQLENEGKQVGIANKEANTNRFNAKTARQEANQKAKESGVYKNIEWAKIHNEEKALRTEVQAATGKVEKEAAEQAADAYENAVNAGINYISNTKLNQQKPQQLLSLLTNFVGRKEALKIMMHLGSPKAAKFAKTALMGSKAKVGKAAEEAVNKINPF
jgi:hypothetical protein